MKKINRTIKFTADLILWTCVYLLPLILFVIRGEVALSAFFDNFGFSLSNSNIVLSSLISLFGSGGVLPLFESTDILIYLSYFVSVFIVHLAVDFLLFIPRIAHNFMKRVVEYE